MAALFDGQNRQERGELIGGRCGQAREGLFEPDPGIRTALLAGGGEARQDGQAAAAVVVAEEEPVFAVMPSLA